MHEVTVIGGGLAGCEAALQLASRGIRVKLFEMRPKTTTPAHRTPFLAELVCSNSLKSTLPETASGLLKREMEMLGCFLLRAAEGSRVPAGHALAVDRELFAESITGEIEADPLIDLERREITDLDIPGCVLIATGPLTSNLLSSSIATHLGSEHLYFYDAISLSVSMESVSRDAVFLASRYGKGGEDYWNIPLTSDDYEKLTEFLRNSPTVEKKGFENGKCFEACLPVEIIASRGKDSLRFGPLKPKGLKDPLSGREPYAVIQMRQEKKDGSMLGLVGFQTRLTMSAQKAMLEMIPGLREAEVLRWGSIHRNTYIDSPRLLDDRQMSTKREGLFFAGQLTGVEGYVESIAHGMLAAINVSLYLEGGRLSLLPSDTMIGAIQRYLVEGSLPFQPMNANFGLLPPAEGNRRERKSRKAERAVESLGTFIEENKRALQAS
jgi:methylenetetrahydrofolate--tRNA-(uracil-5-)-methyltransferase